MKSFFLKKIINSRTKRSILVFPFVLLLLAQCAKVVAPAGGPKDVIPPNLVKSVPLPSSTNFEGTKIILTFDEFIQTPEISQKLIVSPPQEQPPVVKQKGKSLELNFKEPLIENTTYTLYFSDAIADNNEGNKIPNFEFAFSTGDVIDSLSFSGKVVDAFTLTPVEGTLVMLYSSFEDTLPLTTRPLYLSKTSKNGDFLLSNLKSASYKIFALTDMNSNYIFDQQTEAIAFNNEPVRSEMLKFRSSKPTINGDSISENTQDLLQLRLFVEENRIHSLTDFSRSQRRQLRLIFTQKPEIPVHLKPIQTQTFEEKWFIQETNKGGDTLIYWITDSKLSKNDTLQLLTTYGKTDSLQNIVEETDTLRFFYEEKKDTDRQRKKEVAKPTSLPVKISFTKNKLPKPTDRLSVEFNMPLASIDTTLLILENLTDSATVTGIHFLPDSLNPRLFNSPMTWKPNVKYRFTALPGAFINLDSVTNDTIKVDFAGVDPEQYGTLNLKLAEVTSNVIVELLTEKGNFVERKIVNTDGVIPFTYIAPGKYYFRFIVDSNGNGKWDTGWYIKGIQPERIIVHEENGKPKISTVRANWEYDVDFTFPLTN